MMTWESICNNKKMIVQYEDSKYFLYEVIDDFFYLVGVYPVQKT